MSLELFSFFAVAFVIAVTPGPSVVYVVTYSLRYGIKAGIVSTLGINLGSVFAILIAAFGLSSLLEVYPNAITLIQVVGGFYVIYLATLMWPRGQVLSMGEQGLTDKGYRNLFKNGFVTSVLNPKDILFYTAFIPAFIPQGIEGSSYQAYFLFLAFSFMLIGLITKSAFAVFSGYTKSALDSKNASLMSYLSSGVLFSLGLFLVAKSVSSLFPL